VPTVSPESVALALVTALATEQYAREQTVELVWTGPDVRAIPLRRTDQALLQVVEQAQQALLIVSFAVYRIPLISQAIVDAAGRGARVRICLESSESGDQRVTYDTIKALGHDVVERTEIYVWPLGERPRDDRGRAGALHAKCAVADERLLFVSSANLTEYAMNLNLELGVLIQNGDLPRHAVCCFDELILSGALQRAK
jgi:phosphatidylserine/phosphatidylglycerophosphate/cardiolipin synthase-like enzyme